MRHTQNVVGLALGLVFGWLVTPVVAQAIASYRIDPQNAACWDQPAASLADARALKVRVSYDGGQATDTQHLCVGSTSPFACNTTTTVPMSVQTVGRHRIIVTGATVDPVDGSLSDYATLVNYEVDFRTAPHPPAAGSNGRIIKLIQAIARAFVNFWQWLT